MLPTSLVGPGYDRGKIDICLSKCTLYNLGHRIRYIDTCWTDQANIFIYVEEERYRHITFCTLILLLPD